MDASLLVALITGLTPAVIQLVRYAVPRIPKVALPVLAPIIGGLVQAGLTLLPGLEDQGVVVGALAGMAGTGLREILDQVRKAAAESPA